LQLLAVVAGVDIVAGAEEEEGRWQRWQHPWVVVVVVGVVVVGEV
jgi:hypothetical protein